MKILKVIGLTLLGLMGLVVVLLIGYWVWDSYVYAGLQVTADETSIPIQDVLNRSTPEQLLTANSGGTHPVVLITLDTLRADHLSTYGYFRETSPNIDAFARDAVTFNRAYTPMSTTAPAHASLLSALYPVQHRLLQNGFRMRRDVMTLTEMLDAAGYRTGAFVSTDRHFRSSHVAQGFDRYDEPRAGEQIVDDDSRKEPRDVMYRPGRRTLSAAKDWLQSVDSGEKVFLWVHLFDPHYPYVVRKEYTNKTVFGDEDRVRDWIRFIRNEHYFDLLGGTSRTISGSKRVWAYRYYDAEIRYMDQVIGELLEAVRKNLDSDPLTVLAGDHGEGMGNHGYWSHGREIYSEQVRVPLIVRFPGNRYGGRTVNQVVELNDIMPTVLRSVGVGGSILEQRHEPIEGTPLQTLMEGDTSPFRYAFVQRRHYPELDWWNYSGYIYSLATVREVNHPFENRAFLNYETGRKYALIDREGKYIYRTNHRDEAYDLRTDYYETRNLFPELPDRLGEMGLTLKGLTELLRSEYSSDPDAVDPATQEKLKSLGYIQ